jgi:hypothetical protein
MAVLEAVVSIEEKMHEAIAAGEYSIDDHAIWPLDSTRRMQIRSQALFNLASTSALPKEHEPNRGMIRRIALAVDARARELAVASERNGASRRSASNKMRMTPVAIRLRRVPTPSTIKHLKRLNGKRVFDDFFADVEVALESGRLTELIELSFERDRLQRVTTVSVGEAFSAALSVLEWALNCPLYGSEFEVPDACRRQPRYTPPNEDSETTSTVHESASHQKQQQQQQHTQRSMITEDSSTEEETTSEMSCDGAFEVPPTRWSAKNSGYVSSLISSPPSCSSPSHQYQFDETETETETDSSGSPSSSGSESVWRDVRARIQEATLTYRSAFALAQTRDGPSIFVAVPGGEEALRMAMLAVHLNNGDSRKPTWSASCDNGRKRRSTAQEGTTYAPLTTALTYYLGMGALSRLNSVGSERISPEDITPGSMSQRVCRTISVAILSRMIMGSQSPDELHIASRKERLSHHSTAYANPLVSNVLLSRSTAENALMLIATHPLFEHTYGRRPVKERTGTSSSRPDSQQQQHLHLSDDEAHVFLVSSTFPYLRHVFIDGAHARLLEFFEETALGDALLRMCPTVAEFFTGAQSTVRAQRDLDTITVSNDVDCHRLCEELYIDVLGQPNLPSAVARDISVHFIMENPYPPPWGWAAAAPTRGPFDNLAAEPPRTSKRSRTTTTDPPARLSPSMRFCNCRPPLTPTGRFSAQCVAHLHAYALHVHERIGSRGVEHVRLLYREFSGAAHQPVDERIHLIIGQVIARYEHNIAPEETLPISVKTAISLSVLGLRGFAHMPHDIPYLTNPDIKLALSDMFFACQPPAQQEKLGAIFQGAVDPMIHELYSEEKGHAPRGWATNQRNKKKKKRKNDDDAGDDDDDDEKER